MQKSLKDLEVGACERSATLNVKLDKTVTKVYLVDALAAFDRRIQTNEKSALKK